jgi:molybdate transport system substrate-binding protein
MPRLFVALCAVAALLAHPAHAQNPFITVYAAASLKNAVDDINHAFTSKTKTEVRDHLRRVLGAGGVDRAGR